MGIPCPAKLSRLIAVLTFCVAQMTSAQHESCRKDASPGIIAHWDTAIATYDPIGLVMYLEFEVLHKAHVPESCTDGMTALVELDGVTVATTGDSEAGVLIENVGLGRHWLSIRVVGEGRGDVAHETVEFVLQPGAGGGVDWSEFPVVHPEDCNDENIVEFVQEHGGSIGPVAISSFPAPGDRLLRGLAATRAIKFGEAVSYIPRNLSLSIFNAADHPLIGTESMAQLIRETDQVSALAAYLLYEAGNRSSFYRPYLCALPRSVPLPAFSRYADLQTSGLARSATFIRSVELMRKAMADSYIFASRNLFDARRDLFPTRPSLSAWLWAQSIIQSRAFVVTLSTNKMQHPFITLGMLESIPVLVPFIELANHAVGSRQVQISEEGFTIFSDRELELGGMVTVSYGDSDSDICNMELLLKWGFSIPGNPITTCKQDRSASSRSISRVISKIKTTQGQFRIIGHWDSAIATYDAMSRRMYLEFEVLQEPPESHIDGMTALVELDGVTVAKTEDPKAEVLIENVGLGRHWLSIRVVGAGRGDVAHETVEILLPYHYEVLITEPQDLMLVSRKEDLRVCAAISPPANCSRNQCTPSQSSAVLNLIVDGVTAGIVSDVKGTQHVTSKCRSFSFGAMWHEGWHSLAVELVSKDGIPSGPISYMHRVVLVDEGRLPSDSPESNDWLQTMSETPLQAMWDVELETQGVFSSGGPFVGPCLYRTPGESQTEWGLLFREFQHKAAGEQGYRMQLGPSVHWVGRIEWDGKEDGVPLRSGVGWLRVQMSTSRRLDIEMSGEPSMEGMQSAEDARLVAVGGLSLLWFNGNSKLFPSRVTQQFVRLPAGWWAAEVGTNALLQPSEVRLSHSLVEKNFVAFDHHGALLFASAVEPHSIFQLDLDSGAATVKYRTTNEVLNKVISGADVWLLGGAVAIKVRRNGNVEYLSVCSAQGPGRETYRSFVYTFLAEPPFSILAWSPALTLIGQVEQVMGVDVVGNDTGSDVWEGIEGEELMVSYGNQDMAMRVAFFSLSGVLASLVNVTDYF